MEEKRGRTWWWWARRVVAFLLAGTALWLSIRQVHFASLLDVLAGARLDWVTLAVLSVVATTGLKAVRWHLLLRRCHPRASLARLIRLLFIGQLANTFMPRLGDVVRAIWLGSEVEGGALAVFGSLVVEKALDALLGLVILLALIAWTPLPAWLAQSLAALSAATAVLLLVLLVVRAGRMRLAAVMRWLPSGAGERIGRLVSDFLLGLDLLHAPVDATMALLLSVGIWSLAALTNGLTMRALGIDAPGWTLWLILVTGYAATFLPTVPAQLGLFEYAAMLSLQAGGVAAEPALAFALVLHLAVQGPPAVLGALSMAVEGIQWQGLWAARGSVERTHAP